MKNYKKFTYPAFLSFFVLFISNFYTKKDGDFYDPSGDSGSYLSLAKSLNENQKFVRYEFVESGFETIRTPIYSLLLSAFNIEIKAIIFLQFFLHCLTALIMFQLLSRKTSNKIACVSSLVFLFNPVMFSQSQLVLTETLSIFLLSLCVFLFFEKRSLLLFTLIISLLPLLRPSYVLTVFLILVFNKYFFHNYNLKKKLLIFIILLFPTISWSVRNYNQTSIFTLSTLPSMNLLEETASGIKAINEDLESNESILSVLNVEYEERRYWSQVLRNDIELGEISRVIANAPGQSPHLVAPSYQRYAISIILEHPLELGILVMRSLIYVFLEPGDQIYNYVFEIQTPDFFIFLITLINLVIFFCVLGFFKNVKKHKNLYGIIILYFSTLLPLLLLATPSARFGSYLVFFNLFFSAIYLQSKNIKFLS